MFESLPMHSRLMDDSNLSLYFSVFFKCSVLGSCYLYNEKKKKKTSNLNNPGLRLRAWSRNQRQLAELSLEARASASVCCFWNRKHWTAKLQVPFRARWGERMQAAQARIPAPYSPGKFNLNNTDLLVGHDNKYLTQE